jgi:2-polyprenyl-6-methoxyphenol hydroxylase-like FAD-dependent oxidoreductase
MKVLISGAGIAGPTLAYWLTKDGVETTIVEQAPALRTGGYIIDFWGAGLEVANRMGLMPEIENRGYMVQEVRAVNRGGRPVAKFPASAFSSATGGAFTSLPRGDLAATLFAAIAGKVETIFGDAVVRLEQTETGVNVAFERGRSRTFDLVLGADGLHSRIRELVFGAEPRFERYLGLKVAAFEAEGYRPRDELVYVMHTSVGQQVSRFAMRNDRTMFLFTFADDDPELPRSVQAQNAILRRRFGHSGWECPQILDALDSTSDLYFDRVSQIRMNAEEGLWTKDRVTLVGDAAFCVSLLGGQGSALAMAAAYILAGELRRAKGDHREAFGQYQRRFGPFVAEKQRAAQRFAGAFAPRSAFALFIRNQIFQLLSVRWIANAIAGRGFRDRIELPEY